MKNQAVASAQGREPVASYRHSLGFLGIVAAVVLAGFAAQHRATVGGGLATAHQGMIPLYLSAIFMNGMLVYFVWVGVRPVYLTLRGGTVMPHKHLRGMASQSLRETLHLEKIEGMTRHLGDLDFARLTDGSQTCAVGSTEEVVQKETLQRPFVAVFEVAGNSYVTAHQFNSLILREIL